MNSELEKTLVKSNVSYIKVKYAVPKLKEEICAILSGYQLITSVMSVKDQLAEAGAVELAISMSLALLALTILNKCVFWIATHLIYPYEVIITERSIHLLGLMKDVSIKAGSMDIEENSTDAGPIFTRKGLKLLVTDNGGWRSVYVKDINNTLKKEIITLITGEEKI